MDCRRLGVVGMTALSVMAGVGRDWLSLRRFGWSVGRDGGGSCASDGCGDGGVAYICWSCGYPVPMLDLLAFVGSGSTTGAWVTTLEVGRWKPALETTTILRRV